MNMQYASAMKARTSVVMSVLCALASGVVLAQTAQTVQYSYDTQGRLSTVTQADGSVQTYLYENASFPNALTGMKDENGSVFSTWTYDVQGRAIATSEAGGAGAHTLVYNADGSVTVTGECLIFCVTEPYLRVRGEEYGDQKRDY